MDILAMYDIARLEVRLDAEIARLRQELTEKIDRLQLAYDNHEHMLTVDPDDPGAVLTNKPLMQNPGEAMP